MFIPGKYIWFLNQWKVKGSQEYFRKVDQIVKKTQKVFVLFGILGEDYLEKNSNIYFEDIKDEAVFNHLLQHLISLILSQKGRPLPAYSNFNAYVKFLFRSFAGFLEIEDRNGNNI